MATPTGTISMSDVNIELGNASTALITLNDPAVRDLAGVASGAISMDDLRGKSSELGWQLEGLKGQDYWGAYEAADGEMRFYDDGTAGWYEMGFGGEDWTEWVTPPIFDSSSAGPGAGAAVEYRLTRLSGDAPTRGNITNGTWLRMDVYRYFGWRYTDFPNTTSSAGGTFRLELRAWSTGELIDTAEFTCGITF